MISAGADAERPCGYVENIGREDQKSVICTLSELKDKEVNMFTTVFIGNSQTRILESSVNGARLAGLAGHHRS